MKFIAKITMIILLTVSLGACSTNHQTNQQSIDQPSLTISAAISLTDALTEIKTLYENNHSVTLTFNLGGSGSLAQQIQQGAPVDLFISANEDWMDTLENEKLLLENTRTNVTGNQLVLISNQEGTLADSSLKEEFDNSDEQIAIGNPASVPVGKYTEDALRNIGLWDDLQNQIILAKDVRQVLTYVETGNVTYGFVYASDAKHSNDATILTTLSSHLHEPITYPGAVLSATKYPTEAKEFLTFLSSAEAQEIFKKYGFQS